MPRRVILRPQVPDDLDAILTYLEQHSIEVADRFIGAVSATFEDLALMPGKGSPKQLRLSRLVGVRSWAVTGFASYLIFYQTTAEAIVILGVIHGARNVRELLRQRVE
jgi:plasmid stabilization system protein ParE